MTGSIAYCLELVATVQWNNPHLLKQFFSLGRPFTGINFYVWMEGSAVRAFFLRQNTQDGLTGVEGELGLKYIL